MTSHLLYQLTEQYPLLFHLLHEHTPTIYHAIMQNHVAEREEIELTTYAYA